LGDGNAQQIERYFYLQSLDYRWKEHLLTMDLLRESIGLRGYGHKDPKVEYKKDGYALFVEMIYKIKEDFIKKMLRVELDESSFEAEEQLNQIQAMNEGLMKMNLDELEPDEEAEKEKLIAEFNERLVMFERVSKHLKGFNFEKEKQEYSSMMNGMQGNHQNVVKPQEEHNEEETEDEDSDEGKVKKEERKFNAASRNQKKKLKKK